MKKKFDFINSLLIGHNAVKVIWLELNHKTKLSEEQYILCMRALRPYSFSKDKQKHYTPSYLKNEYRNLKKNFGFFK